MKKFHVLASIVTILSMAVSSGCTRITPESYTTIAKPVALTQGEIPDGCQSIGQFKANAQSLGFPYSIEKLRYKVGKKGGNLVKLNTSSTSTLANTTVTGTGYKCPELPKNCCNLDINHEKSNATADKIPQ